MRWNPKYGGLHCLLLTTSACKGCRQGNTSVCTKKKKKKKRRKKAHWCSVYSLSILKLTGLNRHIVALFTSHHQTSLFSNSFHLHFWDVTVLSQTSRILVSKRVPVAPHQSFQYHMVVNIYHNSRRGVHLQSAPQCLSVTIDSRMSFILLVHRKSACCNRHERARRQRHQAPIGTQFFQSLPE